MPTTWLALLLFLLTVSPGILFELLAARRRVSAEESAFREISRVVVASLAFTVPASTIVLAVAWPISPGLIPGLLRDSTYFANNYIAVFVLIVAEAALAHAAVYGVHKYLARTDGENIRQISAWSQAFKKERPDGHRVYARVRLEGGTVFSGQVAHFTPELPLENRELVLVHPLFSKTGDKDFSPLPDDFRQVIIRGAQIQTLAVEYRPSGS